MSTYTIKPKYKTSVNSFYNAPTMFIEAQNQDDALEIAKSSALGRFEDWTFHVESFSPRKIFKNGTFKDRTDSKSFSQVGKRKTGQQISRPQRRALRRQQMGTYPPGCRPTAKFKCW